MLTAKRHSAASAAARASTQAPPTVSIRSLGCKANQEEMECLLSRLTEAGFRVVPFGEPTDWTIVNTCTVTGSGDQGSRQAIRRAGRSASGRTGRVVVTGCLAQRDPAGVAALEGVDWVVGNAEKAALADAVLEAAREAADDPAIEAPSATRLLVGADPTLAGFASYGLGREGRRTRATLKIQDGCDEHCTFCVIPRVRGRARSRPLDDVLRQAETLVRSGYREIALTGINSALWGRDLPGEPELPTLAEALAGVEGLARIRLNSLEPQYVTSRWLDRFAANRKLCRHFHLPLQSGDPATLRRMNRRYSAAQYARLVRAVVERMPDAAVGGDVLVGFPTEGEDSFRRTRDFLAALPLAYLHVFSYSPRPETASLRLGAPVPPRETRRRSASLRELDARLRRRFADRQRGTVQTVIPEGGAGGGRWQGLTGNYLRARFPWTGEGAPESGPLPVRLGTLGREGFVEAEIVERGRARVS
jgi:threonylcarbamoyladenosine tRNA methylthiotransferase MtaB